MSDAGRARGKATPLAPSPSAAMTPVGLMVTATCASTGRWPALYDASARRGGHG